MMDIVDKTTRSKMMSKIKGKNTKPELIVRSFLHQQGFRFKLHAKNLPGAPDLVLPKYNLTIFVHGCFWHRHAGCAYAYNPKTRVDFWVSKFKKNLERDAKNQQTLIEKGWRVLTIWECGVNLKKQELFDIKNYVTSNLSVMCWPSSPPKKSTIKVG